MSGKKQYSVLEGWVRDLRRAVADHAELGYDAAEVIEDALDMVTADGDADVDDDGQAEPDLEHADAGAADEELLRPLGGPPRVADQVRNRGALQAPRTGTGHLAGANPRLSARDQVTLIGGGKEKGRGTRS